MTGVLSPQRRNSFGPLSGGQSPLSPLSPINYKAASPLPQVPQALGILSPQSDYFKPSHRTRYNELHGNWAILKCQDPNHGQYYYSVCDLNYLPAIRKQKTEFIVDERFLWSEQEIEADYNQQIDPDTIVQQQMDDESQHTEIEHGEEADGLDEKQALGVAYNAHTEAEPVLQRPAQQRQRTLWAQAILSSESQYTYDSTASCTIMALECAMQLQLEHKNYVSRIIGDKEKIKSILKIASMYKSDVHTDVDDVMSSISRYKDNLLRERFHQILVPNWSELSSFVTQIGKEFKSEISCVVTKPPETIFIHFYFPLLGANEVNFSIVQPLIFDSHTRTERQLFGAHMLRFEDIDSFEKYLSLLWPKVDMGPNPNLQQNQVNTVNIDIITLVPNLRDTPKINLKQLQAEFTTLAAKIQPFQQQQQQYDNYNEYGQYNEYKANKNDFGNDNHNQYKEYNALQVASAYKPNKNELGNDSYNQQYPQCGPGTDSVPNSNTEHQQTIKEQKKQIKKLEDFVEKSKTFIAAKSKELRTAQNTISELEKTKQEISFEYNSLAQQLTQNISKQTDNNIVNEEVKSQCEKLQTNRNYLIKQLAETKKRNEETKDAEKRKFNEAFQKMVETKDAEKRKFNETLQKMVESKDAEKRKFDAAIQEKNAQIAALLAELKPHRDEKARIEFLNRTYNCQICMDEFRVQGDCFLMDCGHMLNRNCALQAFKADIQNVRVLPRCPMCLAMDKTITDVTELQLELLADQQLMDHYYNLTLSLGVQGIAEQQNAGKIFKCPTADCIFLAEIPDDLERFNCNKCGNAYCTKCKRAYHHKETCEQYKDRKCKEEKLSEQQLEKLAKKNGWKKCPKCRHWIERTYGCFHMTCGNPQCKAEYCDSCGKTLDKKKWKLHFNHNKCPLWGRMEDLIDNDVDFYPFIV